MGGFDGGLFTCRGANEPPLARAGEFKPPDARPPRLVPAPLGVFEPVRLWTSEARASELRVFLGALQQCGRSGARDLL